MDEKPQILIVDDDRLILKVMQQLLNQQKLACLTCTSGEEALEILEKNDSVKLVMVDLLMPRMNGVELLQRIQQRNPEMPVIIITGHLDPEMADSCMKIGAKDYITKPFDFQYMVSSVLVELIPSFPASTRVLPV